jgi:predicted Rossmann fold nucleotide-binding protein DprA/Smf involved in DNA uptake
VKIAVVGSRGITVQDIGKFLGQVDEIVSGGAIGVDACAAEYARGNGIKLTEFLPRYDLYGRAAPIIRNRQIVDYADKVIVFWDGSSRGSLSVIKYAEKVCKSYEIILVK